MGPIPLWFYLTKDPWSAGKNIFFPIPIRGILRAKSCGKPQYQSCYKM